MQGRSSNVITGDCDVDDQRRSEDIHLPRVYELRHRVTENI